ncbi:HAMP domain-containing sensor histidine kinase [Kribbella albertanoniae]|uniref:histidine kinase n=1 Tax=Kribbella albertanoniae TaxID=1266829 RepID=A0A4R4PYK9_9ACTN|nr:ATP-binding protein [Kribbella albertanoniae]TDC27670.1 HAMP domain-containing protein [Kribbella albertanoniae]
MRRSLLFRFLGLSLAVALGAVVATAVIASYSTTEQLQGELQQNAGQLEVDGQIYGELSSYAVNHSGWSGVDKEVRRLADELGRRIALTKPDGTVIADSARVLGAAPELPSVPAATIDARNEGAHVFTSAVQSAAVTVAPASGAAFPTSMVRTAAFPPGYSWGLTAKEKDERQVLAEQAKTCLTAEGVESQVSVTDGAPMVALDAENVDGVTVRQVWRPSLSMATFGSASVAAGGAATPSAAERCVPKGLYAPSAKAKLVNDDEFRRASACLTTAKVPFTPLTDTDTGLRTVSPKDQEKVPAQFFECSTQARSQAIAPYVAPTAKLYLGSKSSFNVFSGEGMLRTAATALGVMLIAALVMLLTGRRLVRPIVALTGAAQRMRNGDHAARVPVTGKDEVARLGHAFNAMAESIQRSDFQRKAMVSDVAHELRTPLANIKGYLVASEDGVVPLDGELVTSLLEETGLLEHLVADLQDLALADAGMLRLHPAPRDLSELAQQVVLAHRPAAETAGVTLTADVPPEAVVSIDSARMRQALGNLVSNAIRYTPTGGTIVVGVRRVDDGYKLTVTDNGAGIADEHLPHLFDRFYRAEQSRSRSTGGSGLGLAITKHLAEAHHGRITVTSKLGEGSVFTLWLPLGT